MLSKLNVGKKRLSMKVNELSEIRVCSFLRNQTQILTWAAKQNWIWSGVHLLKFGRKWWQVISYFFGWNKKLSLKAIEIKFFTNLSVWHGFVFGRIIWRKNFLKNVSQAGLLFLQQVHFIWAMGWLYKINFGVSKSILFRYII